MLKTEDISRPAKQRLPHYKCVVAGIYGNNSPKFDQLQFLINTVTQKTKTLTVRFTRTTDQASCKTKRLPRYFTLGNASAYSIKNVGFVTVS